MQAQGRQIAPLALVLSVSLGLSPVLGQVELQEGPAAEGEQEAPSEESPEDSQETAEEAPVEAVSDASRVLRIDEAIRLDRAKLRDLEKELGEREGFFEEMAEASRSVHAELEEKRKTLEELPADADPDERPALEGEIEKLERELGLLETQSDLAFTSLTTIRTQIEALEEKLEREQHALDVLSGVAPREPAARPPAPAAVTQPGAVPTTVPIVPGVPPLPAPTETPPEKRPETTAQLEALRNVERLEAEARRAEEAVVEFVERKESLEEQIELEGRLLETAKGSAENLGRALETRRADLEQAVESGDRAQVRRFERSVARIERMIDETQREIDERTAYLDSLSRRLERLGEEGVRVTAEAEAKEEEAEKARKSLRWLRSPIHPQNVLRWARQRGPRILMVLVAVVALLVFLRLTVQRVARLVVRRGRGKRAAGTNRADTLAFSFRSAMTLLVLVAGILLVFQEAGVDVKTVLGGAAILGVAVAFGAQNLMRDYFTGFLILLEDQFELGDLVTIGNITGTVESVNMRITMLRDLEGRMHFIPNGEIKSVTNRTYEWGRAVVEIPVGYNEDVDQVMEHLLAVGKELRADPEYGEWVMEDPVMLGVDKFTDYGVIIKFMVQTRPDKMFPVRRELLRRIKKRLDEAGIEISVPHRVLVQRQQGTTENE
jgi:small conductance mechanosensitive channel